MTQPSFPSRPHLGCRSHASWLKGPCKYGGVSLKPLNGGVFRLRSKNGLPEMCTQDSYNLLRGSPPAVFADLTLCGPSGERNPLTLGLIRTMCLFGWSRLKRNAWIGCTGSCHEDHVDGEKRLDWVHRILP